MDTDNPNRRGESMKASATIVRRPKVATGLLDQAGELLLVAIDGVYLSEPVALRLHPDEVQAVVDRSSDASEPIEAERAWSSAAIEAMQRKVPESVTACYLLIEKGLPPGPWVLGDTYSICDPYLFALAQWLEDDGVDMSLMPRIATHRRRVAERPATRRALAQENG